MSRAFEITGVDGDSEDMIVEPGIDLNLEVKVDGDWQFCEWKKVDWKIDCFTTKGKSHTCDGNERLSISSSDSSCQVNK